MRTLPFHINALAESTPDTVALRETAKSSRIKVIQFLKQGKSVSKENLVTYTMFSEKQLVENERMTAGVWLLSSLLTFVEPEGDCVKKIK